MAMQWLNIFLKAKTKTDFMAQLCQNPDMSLAQAETYFHEIDVLLQASNTIEDIPLKPAITPSLPEHSLGIAYQFGSKTILMHYGSERIKSLIHPQWAHVETRSPKTVTSNFSISKKDAWLFLFKDNTLLDHYPITDYHLLQGRLALELINTLYDKKESDWIATLHASTVCNTEEAIMLIGDSGNGKSTLSALLMARGLDVLADDFTPLSATNSQVYRYPSGISVKQGTFKLMEPLFPEFKNYPEHDSYSKTVRIKYIPPLKKIGTAATHLPCTKIVYVHYIPTSNSSFRPINTAQILPTLIPDSWLSPIEANAKLFLDWLKTVQCYELHYADNAYASLQIKNLLGL